MNIFVLFIFFLPNALMDKDCSKGSKIKQQPEPIDVKRGKNGILKCRIHPMRKEDNCTWFKNYKEVRIEESYKFIGKPEEGNCSIKIRNSTFNRDDGSWSCGSSRNATKNCLTSPPIKYTVLVEPKVPTIKMINDRQFQCKSKGGNPAPKLVWIYSPKLDIVQNKNITNNVSNGKVISVLRLSSNKATWHGENLTCVAEHQLKNQSCYITIPITTKKTSLPTTAPSLNITTTQFSKTTSSAKTKKTRFLTTALSLNFTTTQFSKRTTLTKKEEIEYPKIKVNWETHTNSEPDLTCKYAENITCSSHKRIRNRDIAIFWKLNGKPLNVADSTKSVNRNQTLKIYLHSTTLKDLLTNTLTEMQCCRTTLNTSEYCTSINITSSKTGNPVVISKGHQIQHLNICDKDFDNHLKHQTCMHEENLSNLKPIHAVYLSIGALLIFLIGLGVGALFKIIHQKRAIEIDKISSLESYSPIQKTENVIYAIPKFPQKCTPDVRRLSSPSTQEELHYAEIDFKVHTKV